MVTTVETRLRGRVDLLTDQRDELERQRDLLAWRILQLERRLGGSKGRCVYCGEPTGARDGACRAHGDLPRLEGRR